MQKTSKTIRAALSRGWARRIVFAVTASLAATLACAGSQPETQLTPVPKSSASLLGRQLPVCDPAMDPRPVSLTSYTDDTRNLFKGIQVKSTLQKLSHGQRIDIDVSVPADIQLHEDLELNNAIQISIRMKSPAHWIFTFQPSRGASRIEIALALKRQGNHGMLLLTLRGPATKHPGQLLSQETKVLNAP